MRSLQKPKLISPIFLPYDQGARFAIYMASNFGDATKTYIQTSAACSNDIISSGFNDQLSSIRVNYGCIRIYDAIDCGGNYREYRTDVALTSDFNDVASSFRQCPGAVFNIYTDINFGGTTKDYRLENTACSNALITDGFNDQVTSVTVAWGCVRFYAAIDCQGDSIAVSKSWSLLPDFNDVASSFRACYPL